MKKTIFTLNVHNEYPKEITDLTYPLLKGYAHKIGAEFCVITERKFPEFSPVYEKVQIYQLAQDQANDWNIYIDCDAIVHPDLMDLTQLIPRDTVAHNGSDFAPVRWKYDRFFMRDGRHIGSCNWFTIASDWCIDLWKPLDDLTPEEAAANIFPITAELRAGVEPARLIDDYVLSRNIAKYGLKFIKLKDLFIKAGFEDGAFLYHQYAMPTEQKVVYLDKVMKHWGLK